MRPIDAVAATLFYPTPDGRVVFRPWGARGPCYLVSEAQRRAFARFQLAYYALMLVAIFFTATGSGGLLMLGVVLPVILAGNYLAFWIFARRLPTTEPPSPPDPEYRRALIRQGNRAFGKTLGRIMLVLSLGFVATGLWLGWATGRWGTALPAIAFFGVGAGVFVWQLRNQ